MDRKLAIDIVTAVACCSEVELTCRDCPLWDEKIHLCRPWTDEEACEAVRVLNRERREGE